MGYIENLIRRGSKKKKKRCLLSSASLVCSIVQHSIKADWAGNHKEEGLKVESLFLHSQEFTQQTTIYRKQESTSLPSLDLAV